MFSEQQLMHKALLQDTKCKKVKIKIFLQEKKPRKQQNRILSVFAVSHWEGARQIFMSFNNLSETDDIHVPLILSSCGLKDEIFIGCRIYMSADERRSKELNSQPWGS